jgi:hypothetical protein
MAIKRGKARTGSKGTRKDLLLENFVLLQRTLVETAAALKEINQKINSMLELFEEASRVYEAGKKPSTDIIGRLDAIEEHNAVIAKSLLLLRKQLKERDKYGITRAPLTASVTTRRKKKKKKKEPEEALFKEEFGEGAEETEDEESGEEETDDDYSPKPLPEFSF